MIAYMKKWVTTQILSADPIEGQNAANRLLRKVFDNFSDQSGLKRYLFSTCTYENKQGEAIKHEYIMDHLIYDGSVLFGSIGITSDQMDGMIRERDIVTMEESKVVPSGPNKKFEYYTYFCIYPDRQQLLVLRNGNMPDYIHNLIAAICVRAIEGEPYNIAIEAYQEQTIRERIQELNKSNVELRFALHELEFMNKPSFRQIKAKSEHKGMAYVSMKLSFGTKLDEDVVDELISMGGDPDTLRLVVKDADVPSRDADAIDLLKALMTVKRDVKITKADLENVDFVCSRFKESILTPTC